VQETGFNRCECNPEEQPASGEVDLTCPECNHWLGNELLPEIGLANCAHCKNRWNPPNTATGVEARVCGLTYPQLAAAMLKQAERDDAAANANEAWNSEKAERYKRRADALRSTAMMVFPQPPEGGKP
jgi:hypothetical protein